MSDRIERVMAYVDGELDAAARAAFEVEMAADAGLAAEVAAHRMLGGQLAGVYGPVLGEAVPLRLTLAAKTANDAPKRGWPLPAWAAVAASLVVGVIGGRMVLPTAPGLSVGQPVPARTELARALNSQLTAQPGVVRIGMTFRDTGGAYCRTFQSAPDRLAGLACRDRLAWRLRTATAWRPTSSPDYRTAASDTPPAVLAAVDQALKGEVFDSAQEEAARDGGWR